ncbi:hypothetical protein E8L99_04395 [Phreatobacter aquaticus]|uniref:DUF883 family protein n=1 Tax=Phreatobacter aquaticus TaxID=2570229 RepID=A0A4D7QES0_9HYPH|nr:hypothetical protein [Phreatobacter aquaticus]QCK85071.1 hypothetical protein E8L99_04395 [Phreatobacter aquaticus]
MSNNFAGNNHSGVRAAADEVVERTQAGLREGAEIGESMLRSAGDAAANVNQKLKSAGVDAEAMVDAAKDQASELQKLIADELKAHPMRTLGVAAVVGLIAGLMVSR